MKQESRRQMIGRILNPDTQMRDRLFQLLSTIALAEYILVSGYTIVTGGSISHIVLMLLGTALFAAIVAFTFRTGKIRLGSTVSGLLYFLIYPLTFFSSGGMYGGAPVTFVFALVYVFLVTQKWERVVSLAVCVMGVAACYIVSYQHPQMLTKHTVLEEHVESFLSISLVVLLLCTLFAFVTAVYMTENQIVQKQKKEIEDLNRIQKRFFSSMSHEIRTPVNAIIGLNEMTLREVLSDEVRENSRNIEAASRILLHTINEILDMSRMETGAMEIQPEEYRLSTMLSDINGMTWARAKEKGLEFRIQADPALPAQLRGDEIRIKQILLNVLTNAVKYTKEGSVTLSVRGDKGEGGAFRMIFDVSDTGIGIQEENIPYLFTAFQRLDEQENRAIEGTGLGLTIVKQLLDMMEGSVSVSSEYGRGTTFHIEIPQDIIDESPVGELRQNDSSDPKALRQEQSHFDASQLHILAVDDTPMNLMVLKKLLRDTGAALSTAASGAEALEQTLATKFDVILMDHQMPEMDGIECLHRIRAQEDGLCRDSKILCLTANAGADMEKLYRQEGFDGYLAKPVRGATLEDALRRAVEEA